MNAMFWLLVGILVGAWFGWTTAHIVVAEECDRLGGFFVGRRTFKCHEVINGD